MNLQPAHTLLALLIHAFVSLSVHAQPILTYGNHAPQPGEAYTSYTATLPPSLAAVSATGINYTWDFSTVTPTNGGNFYAHAAPGMTQFGNLYPTATVAAQVAMWGANRIYMKADSTKLEELGFNQLVWTNPRTLITYPFTFNSQYQDTAAYNAPPSYNWIWHVNGVADGYGTVILPYGTVSNVLRVREDVNRYSGLGWVPEQLYFWYQEDTHTPICWYFTDVFFDTYFYYREPEAVTSANAINEPARVKVFPNPATAFFRVQFPAAHPGFFDITLLDVRGSVVYSRQQVPCMAGHNKFEIDSGHLVPGAYVLRLTGNDYVYQHPVMVLR